MRLELTVDEIIDTLKRSSLTTVLVEGVDDVLIYRWIEDEIGIVNANFLPCGGRDKLLQIFDRRAEFSELKTVFVADKDTFVYVNPPEKYSEIIWTNGYSIENDLYFGRKIENLLSREENNIFLQSLNSFVDYYAFEIQNFLDDKEYQFRNHPQHIICDLKQTIKEDFLQERNFSVARPEIKNNLSDNYDVLIRGKSLFALITRLLNKKGRAVKHSKKTLLEHCYRTHKSEKFIELITKIQLKISA